MSSKVTALLFGTACLGIAVAAMVSRSGSQEPRSDPVVRAAQSEERAGLASEAATRDEKIQPVTEPRMREGLAAQETRTEVAGQLIAVNSSRVNTTDLQATSIDEDLAGVRPTQAIWGKHLNLVGTAGDNVSVNLLETEIGLLFGPHVAPLLIRSTGESTDGLMLRAGAPTRVQIRGLEEAEPLPVELAITGVFCSPDHSGVCIPWKWTVDSTSSEISIPTVPGQCLLTVVQGTRKAVWTGALPNPEGVLVLNLNPTFKAGGRISGYPGSTGQPASVTARLVEADVDRVVGRAAVGPGGDWSMEGIPWASERPYWFRLECQDACPSQSRVMPRAPSANEVVNLTWDPGQLQRLKVKDDAGTPVAGVGVKMQWLEGEEWISAYARSGAEGSVRIHHVPETNAYFRVLSDDYAPDAQGPWQVPTHESRTLQLAAERITGFAGQLLPKSLAADGFSVSYWSPLGAPVTKSFGPDAQGYFEISKVRRGNLFLLARCPNGSSSGVELEIDTSLLGDEIVEIDLLPPMLVSGRVVDHLTGKGVSGATVDVRQTSNNGHFLGSHGERRLTGSGGYFHDLQVPAGDATLVVWADEMTSASQPHRFPRSEPGPLPEIRLQPLQALTIRLVGSMDDLDQYQFIQESIVGTATSHFPENGTLHFPACAPSSHAYITIETPLGSIYNIVARLVSGRTWDFPISVGSKDSYIVDYSSVVAAGHAEPYYIRTTYTDSNGVEINHTRAATAENHEYVLRDIPPGILTLALHSSDEWVASRSVDLRAQTSDRIDLVPIKPRGRIRVLGTKSVPLTYAISRIASQRNGGHGFRVYREDNGDLELFAIDLGPAVLAVRNRHHPMMLFTTECVVVDDPESSVEITTVHDAVLRFETWLPSGAPATARLVVHPVIAPDSELDLISSGSGSQAEILVTAGVYRWALDAPQYWPDSGMVEVQSGTKKVKMTVRRPGLVELTGPASTDMVVWSEADEQAVTAWQDLVPELAATRTSAHGKLSLKLPEGQFRAWPASAGPSAAVPFVVVAGDEVAVQVQ